MLLLCVDDILLLVLLQWHPIQQNAPAVHSTRAVGTLKHTEILVTCQSHCSFSYPDSGSQAGRFANTSLLLGSKRQMN